MNVIQRGAFLIRRAKLEDIERLGEICRKSFPYTVEWQAPTFMVRKRWEQIMSSNAAETWVASRNSKIDGLAVLITEPCAYKQQMGEHSSGLLLRICAHMFCPRLFFLKVLRRVLKPLPRTQQHADTIQANPLSRDIWIEPIAVAPEARRGGVGTRLLQHCRQRAAELKKDGVKLQVRRSNTQASKFYEKVGFVCTRRGAYADTYRMKVTEEPSEERREPEYAY
ncbi:MAG: GNAT family N-acetyltransferase [Phycisphaerales bacterium]